MSPKKKITNIKLLIDILSQAYDKPAWHGTNLRGSLRGLKLRQLLWRPSPKRHNIWEIALHAAYWKYAVRRRIIGGKKGEFPRKPSNFPEHPKTPTMNDWKVDLALLEEAHVALFETIEDFPENRLQHKVPGAKYSFAHMIYGVASHDLYHAGQVQMLKRLQQ